MLSCWICRCRIHNHSNARNHTCIYCCPRRATSKIYSIFHNVLVNMENVLWARSNPLEVRIRLGIRLLVIDGYLETQLKVKTSQQDVVMVQFHKFHQFLHPCFITTLYSYTATLSCSQTHKKSYS